MATLGHPQVLLPPDSTTTNASLNLIGPQPKEQQEEQQQEIHQSTDPPVVVGMLSSRPLGTTRVPSRAPSSAGNSFSSHSFTGEGNGNGSGSGNGKEGAAREAMLLDSSRQVRTLPTWVQRREEDEDDILQLPLIAQQRPPERSTHDAQREKTPITPPAPSHQASRWRGFVEGTAVYPPGTAQSEKAGTDWLAQQPDLNSPWLANSQDPENDGEGSADDQRELFGKKKRRIWYKRMNIMLLNSPTVPLTFRSIIWTLSLVALGLACSIFHLSGQYKVEQKASTVLAIIVDAIALVYLIYITYDEYSGQPLGLRSPNVKIRLIMFDLAFIVFDSANLSLAFYSLFNVGWHCRRSPNMGASLDTSLIEPICARQRALAAFLFLALCAWVSTFMVSIFRVVERVVSSR